jgi:glycerophosphoryl diester phosphodiesterase
VALVVSKGLEPLPVPDVQGKQQDEAVKTLHDAGFKVSTWTVDDPPQMRRLLDVGVDAIVTNRVGELVTLLAEARC